MNKDFAVYDPVSGRIKQVVQCLAGFMLCGPDEKFIEVPAGIQPDKWFVQYTQLVERPTLPALLNGRVISSVPKGAEVLIENQVYVADGGLIELEFSLPGSYLVRITHWPYLDWETVIEN